MTSSSRRGSRLRLPQYGLRPVDKAPPGAIRHVKPVQGAITPSPSERTRRTAFVDDDGVLRLRKRN